MPTIILNANNIVSTQNNRLLYQFQGGGVTFKNNEIALSSIQLYYSWYNINQQAYNNNSYAYTWVDGTIVSVTMPDGFYNVAEINAYLESIMVANKHYLVNTTTGDFVYYIQWETNPTYYAVQLNCYVVPSTLPSGYSLPSGATWALPATAQTPRVTISTNGFGSLVGFNAGTYPPTTPYTTTYSKLSDFTPQVQPISSIQITCSLITNPYSSSSKTIYAFGIPETAFGGQVILQPPEFAFNKIVDGNYNEFIVEILDQDGRPITLKDPQMTILLVVRDRGVNQ